MVTKFAVYKSIIENKLQHFKITHFDVVYIAVHVNINGFVMA